MVSSLSMVAQDNRRGEGRRQLTEEQIAEMMKRQTDRVKEQLNLTDDQQAKFETEYTNYMNIIMASRTERFKNRAARPTSADEAVVSINDMIDGQIVDLAAKKQLINNLKDTLTAEQLMKLHQLTSGMGMMNRNRQQQGNRNRGYRGNRGGGFGGQGGFGGGFDNDGDF